MKVRLDLEPQWDSIPRAQHQLRSRLRTELATPVLQDLLSVVTELVTNSVCHGPGKPIHVHIEIPADGLVRGEVEDHGDGRVAVREITDGGSGGGFGLRIVDRLTNRWGVYEGSTHVWFEISEAKRHPAGLD